MVYRSLALPAITTIRHPCPHSFFLYSSFCHPRLLCFMKLQRLFEIRFYASSFNSLPTITRHPGPYSPLCDARLFVKITHRRTALLRGARTLLPLVVLSLPATTTTRRHPRPQLLLLLPFVRPLSIYKLNEAHSRAAPSRALVRPVVLPLLATLLRTRAAFLQPSTQFTFRISFFFVPISRPFRANMPTSRTMESSSLHGHALPGSVMASKSLRYVVPAASLSPRFLPWPLRASMRKVHALGTQGCAPLSLYLRPRACP